MAIETSTSGPSNQAADKGLKKGALGLLSSVVIGVSSTAPGYSLAATLGFVVALVGLQAPVIMILAFVPMFFIAYAYRELNRVAPDCGTTFTWATKAFGPRTGWMGGWGIVAADIIVMASLAQIAGIYGFLMFGAEGLADSTFWTTVVGCLWIAVLTWVCYRGIEISAKLQFVFLAVEVVILVIFAAVALFKVYGGTAGPDSVKPSLSWFNPFNIGSFDGSTSAFSAFTASILLAVFIYWGWDSAVSVNEETSNPETTPGRAAVLSTVILLFTYAIVATATLAFAGPDNLANSDDVFAVVGVDVLGNVDKLLIFAVLTSAAASTQTTILPTARTTLSMAAFQALPAKFARVHPRYFTPTWSTIGMGIASIAFYIALASISDNILGDSASAVGLLIAFYYGLTGFAAAWYFRKDRGDSVRELMARIVMPLAGGILLGVAFVKTLFDDANPDNSYTTVTIFGWTTGGIFVIAVGSLLLGVVLMFITQQRSPAFFAGKTLNRDTEIVVAEEGVRVPVDVPTLPDAPRLERLVVPPLTEEELRAAEAEAREDRRDFGAD